MATNTKPEASKWSTLPAPVTMDTKPGFGGIKPNVLETVPAPIRERAEQSLGVNVRRVEAAANSTAKRPRVDYHWQLQRVTDKAMGQEFHDLITKYAKYRPDQADIPHAAAHSPKGQVTARTGDVAWYRENTDGEWVACGDKATGAVLGIRYSVRPFEQRNSGRRLPGTV